MSYRAEDIRDIMFYGVNEYTRKMKEEAIAANRNVIAFIDRRAEEIGNVDGIPVYKEAVPNSSGDCLIIALQNALQHDEVARKASEKGFEKIIYVPMDAEIDQHKAQVLRNTYNSIFNNDWEAVNESIPFYEEIYGVNSKRTTFAPPSQKTVVRKSDKFVTARVPVELVYTSVREGEYADMPLASFDAYDRMYDVFDSASQEKTLPESYLDKYAIQSCDDTPDAGKTFEMRGSLIEKYTEFFQTGMDFASSCAPLAKLNGRGCFNLCEGQHRTMWLLKQGIYYLPLRISVEDWDKWRNERNVEQIEGSDTLEDIVLSTPISNPYFLGKSFFNKFFLMKLQVEIQRKLYSLIKGKKIFIMESFYGYFAFNLCRMQAAEVTSYVKNAKLQSAYNLLEKIYGINLRYEKDEPKSYDDYDMVFAIGEVEAINKMNVIEKALSNGKQVVSNIPYLEEDSYAHRCQRNYIGKLVYRNRIEFVYVMKLQV